MFLNIISFYLPVDDHITYITTRLKNITIPKVLRKYVILVDGNSRMLIKIYNYFDYLRRRQKLNATKTTDITITFYIKKKV